MHEDEHELEEPRHRGLPRLPPRQGVHWSQAEVAWPLALFGGLAGSWAGVVARVPGLAAAAATVAFVPLLAGVLGRGRRVLAAFLVVGWALGVSGGVVGTLIEEGTGDALVALPLSELWIRARVDPWLLEAGTRPGRWAGLPVAVGAVLAVVAVARLAFGALSLLLGALAIGAVSAGVARCAEAVVAQGGDPVLAVLSTWPPHTALQLLGALLVAAALSQPDRFGGRLPGHRAVQRLGVGLALAGLALEPLLQPVWGAWIASAAGVG